MRKIFLWLYYSIVWLVRAVQRVFFGVGIVGIVALMFYAAETPEFYAPYWVKATVAWSFLLVVLYYMGDRFMQMKPE